MSGTRTIFLAGMAAGALVFGSISALMSGPSAVAQTPPAGARGVAPGGPTAAMDERKLETTYANYFRLYFTAEELVTDFGFVMPNPRSADDQPSNIFDARSRIIMSFPAAKRFATDLNSFIAKYESTYGPISTEGPKPKTPPAGR